MWCTRTVAHRCRAVIERLHSRCIISRSWPSTATVLRTPACFGLSSSQKELYCASRRHASSFQAFSSADEAELVQILTNRPQHVLRKVRQMVSHSRQRTVALRNTITYMMIVLQGRLQVRALDPAIASSLIEAMMQECVQYDAADLAHLLFRASLRFHKYDVTTTPRTLQYLFDTYRAQEDAVQLMRTLAREIRSRADCRALAITAYLYAGEEAEAEALWSDAEINGNLTDADYRGRIQGYMRLGAKEKVLATLRQRPQIDLFHAAILAFRASNEEQTRRYVPNPVRKPLPHGTRLDSADPIELSGSGKEDVSQHRTATVFYGWSVERAELVWDVAHLALELTESRPHYYDILPFHDRAVATLARAALREKSSVEGVAEAEKSLLPFVKNRDRRNFGMSTTTALVAALSRAKVHDETKSDELMREKVHSLRSIVENQLSLLARSTADPVDTNEQEEATDPFGSGFVLVGAGLDNIHLITLIRGYAALGETDVLGQLLPTLRQRGYEPDPALFGEFLRAFALMGNVHEVLRIKAIMEQDRIPHTAFAYASLFRALGKFYPSMVERYEKEMLSMGIRPDASVYAQLIGIYGELGDTEKVDALVGELLRRSDRGGSNLYTPSVAAAMIRSASSSLARATRFIQLAKERGLQKDRYVRSIICHVYARHECLEELHDVLNASDPTEITLELLTAQLQLHGKREDRVAFHATLEKMRREGHVFDEQTFLVLINTYARWGEVERIQEVLQEARHGNASLTGTFYIAVASAFHHLGMVDEVDATWNDMIHSRVAVSTRVYNAFLELYIERNDLNKMQGVLQTMMARVPPNSITMTTVLDMLGKLGRMEDMERLLDEMCASADARPTAVTFHQVMSAYAKRGEVSKMRTILKRYHDAGYENTAISYNILLVGYTKARQYEKVTEIIEEREKKGVPMDEISYGVLIRSYGFSQLEEPLRETIQKALKSFAPIDEVLPRKCTRTFGSATTPEGTTSQPHTPVSTRHTHSPQSESVVPHARSDAAATTSVTSLPSPRLLLSIAFAYMSCKNRTMVEKYVEHLLVHPETRRKDWIDSVSLFSRFSDAELVLSLLNRYRAQYRTAPPAEMYSVAMRGLGRTGAYDSIPILLKSMQKDRVRLDGATALDLSGALLKEGLVELAQHIMKTQPNGIERLRKLRIDPKAKDDTFLDEAQAGKKKSQPEE